MMGDMLSILLVSAGLFFFIAGTAGLIRFPDVHSRIHALTKADNLGLGLIVLGAVAQAPDVWTALKLLSTWLLALVAAATTAQLISRSELDR